MDETIETRPTEREVENRDRLWVYKLLKQPSRPADFEGQTNRKMNVEKVLWTTFALRAKQGVSHKADEQVQTMAEKMLRRQEFPDSALHTARTWEDIEGKWQILAKTSEIAPIDGVRILGPEGFDMTAMEMEEFRKKMMVMVEEMVPSDIEKEDVVSEIVVIPTRWYSQSRKSVYGGHSEIKQKRVLLYLPTVSRMREVSGDKTDILLAAYERTFRHEMAHLIWAQLSPEEQGDVISALEKDESDTRIDVTRDYATGELETLDVVLKNGEKFAEAMAAYFVYPAFRAKFHETSVIFNRWFEK